MAKQQLTKKPKHDSSAAVDLQRAIKTSHGPPLLIFLAISAGLNALGVWGGWYFKWPEPYVPPPVELTTLDANDAPPLLQEEETMPEPEPTPPPEPEPTPPPLEKPPEFEVPQPTPTPSPPPAKPVQQVKPQQTPKGPNPPNAKPASQGGVAGGTGTGGPRGTLLVRSPKPPYPPQALQMHITGDVKVTITVSNGNITDVQPSSGPPMLSSAAARWVRGNWKFAPNVSGTFTLPVTFVLVH
jgi:TonB family protein